MFWNWSLWWMEICTFKFTILDSWYETWDIYKIWHFGKLLWWYCEFNLLKPGLLLNFYFTFFIFFQLQIFIFSTSVDTYDENVNIRSFGYDAMWESIAGYVGMGLGISFLQLPCIIYCGIQFFRNFRRILHTKNIQNESFWPIVYVILKVNMTGTFGGDIKLPFQYTSIISVAVSKPSVGATALSLWVTTTSIIMYALAAFCFTSASYSKVFAIAFAALWSWVSRVNHASIEINDTSDNIATAVRALKSKRKKNSRIFVFMNFIFS